MSANINKRLAGLVQKANLLRDAMGIVHGKETREHLGGELEVICAEIALLEERVLLAGNARLYDTRVIRNDDSVAVAIEHPTLPTVVFSRGMNSGCPACGRVYDQLAVSVGEPDHELMWCPCGTIWFERAVEARPNCQGVEYAIETYLLFDTESATKL